MKKKKNVLLKYILIMFKNINIERLYVHKIKIIKTKKNTSKKYQRQVYLELDYAWNCYAKLGVFKILLMHTQNSNTLIHTGLYHLRTFGFSVTRLTIIQNESILISTYSSKF